MSHATTEHDTVTAPLRDLAARDAVSAAAPYDFGEFTRRAAARRDAAAPGATRRALRFVAMVAPLALLLSIAGVEHHGVETDASDALAAAVAPEPALVRVGATGRVNDLEDRIAWFDSMISEAPVAGLSAEDRAALQSSRDALANSLQRVRYAQALLAY
jgi:hypothetical protein